MAEQIKKKDAEADGEPKADGSMPISKGAKRGGEAKGASKGEKSDGSQNEEKDDADEPTKVRRLNDDEPTVTEDAEEEAQHDVESPSRADSGEVLEPGIADAVPGGGGEEPLLLNVACLRSE